MRHTLAALTALLVLAGCNNPPPVATTDAGTTPETDAAVDACGPPTPPATNPYGTSVGRSLRQFTLPQCDGSGDYSFYGDNQWCDPDHRLTVLLIAAVWCVPCNQESSMLTDAITELYRDQGVRVIQVLVDGPTRGGGATMEDCQNWIARYGLTNVELLDSGGTVTGAYFPSGYLPSTVIIDDEGIIRFYDNRDGVGVGIPAMQAEIERLLAEP